MILEVQKFLHNNGLDKLQSDYSIIARRHSEYNNLICLKYNMIDSPMAKTISQECRGLILDEDNDWSIVSYPFNKFFNSAEGLADSIDWNTAKVVEKCDGSLMTLYHYDNKWHVQSSGTADAVGPLNTDIPWREDGKLVTLSPNSFASYFWKIATLTKMDINPLMKSIPTDMCFMFEVMGPLNRIIVRHDISKIVLIGARNIKTGKELTVEDAVKLLPGNVPIVKTYSLKTMEDINTSLPNINPLDQEGYVVLDAEFNRVKVKAPAYVAMHHAKGNEVTFKKLLAIAVAGENDEWVAYFDEHKEDMAIVRNGLSDLIFEVESDYKEIISEVGGEATAKEFAMLAKNTRCPSALFAFRSGKIDSIKSYIRNIRLDSLISLIDFD